MIRTFVAVAGLTLAALAAADAASAQTWGQPLYVSPYGHGVGGTPLSEVETRSYVNTGRWADGYSDQAYVYLPARVTGPGTATIAATATVMTDTTGTATAVEGPDTARPATSRGPAIATSGAITTTGPRPRAAGRASAARIIMTAIAAAATSTSTTAEAGQG